MIVGVVMAGLGCAQKSTSIKEFLAGSWECELLVDRAQLPDDITDVLSSAQVEISSSSVVISWDGVVVYAEREPTRDSFHNELSYKLSETSLTVVPQEGQAIQLEVPTEVVEGEPLSVFATNPSDSSQRLEIDVAPTAEGWDVTASTGPFGNYDRMSCTRP